MPPRRLVTIVWVLSALLLPGAGPANASSLILWTVETLDDFERGKPTRIAVQSDGTLSLTLNLTSLKAPLLEESGDPFLWAQAVDGKGNLYVGGGKNGAIYRMPRGAAGSLYFETGDLAVHALTVDRSNVLYAGSSPQGSIYRITGEARGEVYYKPEDRYIWSLAAGPKGAIFAATGERGIIYKITARGKAETFFDSEESHIVSLALDGAGNLLAGSDGKGLLYRINPQGKATVLYDSALREINAIAVDASGTIYAASLGVEGTNGLIPPLLLRQEPAVGREAPPAGLPGQPPVPIPGIDEGSTTTVRVTASAAGTAPVTPLPKSEVVRIDPDGTSEVLWSSQSEVVYAVTLDPSGRPIIGTGEPGRIRVLEDPLRSTLLALLPQSQVTSLITGPDKRVFAATSNVGHVYMLDSATSESGTYLSAPHDAQSLARWGRISWRASLPQGARTDISTRSGNSGQPDETWSDWSPSYADPEGSVVTSPKARFLQWRARLTRSSGGASPSLRAVSVAYMQMNLTPVLERLTIHPPGVIRERPGFVPPPDPAGSAFTGFRLNPGRAASNGPPPQIPGKQVYVRGMRSFEWAAKDLNGDVLSYDLLFRGEDETAWKPLARGLRETYFAFDSMQLPDGLYRIRLEASDGPSNPGETARSAHLVSDTILIDNAPPAVRVTAGKGSGAGRVTIDVSASDAVGPIARAEYSLDARGWVPVQPVDGVSDSRAESYRLTLEALRPGEHTVIVKVIDLLGNVGAGKATFTSP